MGLITTLQLFFSRIFVRDPEEATRRAELHKIHVLLAETRPPYFRPKQNLVLPAFAQSVFSFATTLKPLAELARATVANADVRVSQRFFDHLIDCKLSPESRKRKEGLAYETMSERVLAAFDSDHELEIIAGEFQSLLREIEVLGPREINTEFAEIDRFIEICRHDYERVLGLFDPGISLDAPDRRPDFSAADGEQILPELVDLFYVTDGFFFSPNLRQNLRFLLERRSTSGDDSAKHRKLEKICNQLEKVMDDKLAHDTILALLRAAKADPHFLPPTDRTKRDFVDSYRHRLSQQFERDRDRIQRERHDNAIQADIKLLFGDAEILEVDGYDDEADAYLRRESPTSFSWIKPMRILKTFVAGVFDPSLKEAIKRILVEGYFDNKNYQNNLANILYQCERSGARITDFEAQMLGNGRISIVAMKRFVEEMRRGKDIAPFLNRLVDAINGRAKEIVEDEAGLFAMLGDSLSELLTDYKKASPDLVNNIRTFAGGRNREIMAQILAGRDKILLLVKVMRNFTFIKAPMPGSQAAMPMETGAAGIEPPPRQEGLDDEDGGLESLDEV